MRVEQRARGETICQADAFIIATGTKPAESPKVPVNGRTIINSDQMLQLPELPKTLIVVGGGVIGVEYTCMFATLGVRVDPDRKAAPAAGIRRPGNRRGAVLSPARQPRDHAAERRSGERGGDADGGVVANLESKKKISGDALLYAVGRQGNVDELNLAAAGLEADDRGRISGRRGVPHQGSRTSSRSAT